MTREEMRKIVRDVREREAVGAPPTAEQATQLSEATQLLLQRVEALEAKARDSESQHESALTALDSMASPEKIESLLDRADKAATTTEELLQTAGNRLQIYSVMAKQAAELERAQVKKSKGNIRSLR